MIPYTFEENDSDTDNLFKKLFIERLCVGGGESQLDVVQVKGWVWVGKCCGDTLI